jgi:hypothetical protein
MIEDHVDDSHDKLILALLEYYKAREWWEDKHSTRSYWATQKAIREVRTQADKINRELRKLQQQKDEERQNYSYRQKLVNQEEWRSGKKKNQNQKGKN